jgi:hypothetical protein
VLDPEELRGLARALKRGPLVADTDGATVAHGVLGSMLIRTLRLRG